MELGRILTVSKNFIVTLNSETTPEQYQDPGECRM